MTWEQILSSIKKYRIVLSICAVLLAVLAWDIATSKNKLYIQTAQTEDDFVIVCGWYSGFLSLHGGMNRINYRVLVGKSNTELECGWSLYGHIQVTVSHPLYRHIYGYDDPELVSPDFRYQDGKMIFTPVPFDQFLNSLQDKYEGEELDSVVKAVTSGQVSLRYFKNYVEVRRPDMDRYKKLYHEHLKGYWQISNTIIDSEKDSINPKEAMERYWAKVDEFLQEYY